MEVTVKKIVADFLEANGYDGLFLPEVCACKKDDLAPCDEHISMQCQAGYLTPCDCGDPDHDWHISAEKPDATGQDQQQTAASAE